MKRKGDKLECEEGPEYLEMNRTCNMLMQSEYVDEQNGYIRIGNFSLVDVSIFLWGKVLHIPIPYCVVVLCRCLTLISQWSVQNMCYFTMFIT